MYIIIHHTFSDPFFGYFFRAISILFLLELFPYFLNCIFTYINFLLYWLSVNFGLFDDVCYLRAYFRIYYHFRRIIDNLGS